MSSMMIVAQFPRRCKASTKLYQRVAEVPLAKRRDSVIFDGRRQSALTSIQQTKISAALDGFSRRVGKRSQGVTSAGGAGAEKGSSAVDSVFVHITEENVSVWAAPGGDQAAELAPVAGSGGRTAAASEPFSAAAAAGSEGAMDGADVEGGRGLGGSVFRRFAKTAATSQDFDVEEGDDAVASSATEAAEASRESKDCEPHDAAVGGGGESGGGGEEDDTAVVIDVEVLVHRTMKELYEGKLLLGRHTVSEVSHGYMTVMAAVSAELVHLVVLKLESVGVGSEVGTLSVVPTTMVRASTAAASQKEEKAFHKRLLTRLTDQSMLDAMSQIRIEKLLEDVKAGTTWSFDYAAFLLCASMIAAMGLLSNSVVSIIAAMLVSPIMGPIVALTFGANTRDWALARLGLKLELVSLLACMMMGFIVTVIAMPIMGTSNSLPTSEMEGRTTTFNLLVGVFVALPSGAGVALSLMSDNMASLVGVAISASLLPPAVNCGMYFALACFGNELLHEHDLQGRQLARDGAVSLFLTIENIVCVFIAAYCTFWVKEVAPIKRQHSFWHQDMVRTRKLNAQRGKAERRGSSSG